VEIDDLFFADIEAEREMFAATVTELEESCRQSEVGVAQVRENICTASELATDNVRIEADLVYAIGDYRSSLAEKKERQLEVKTRMHDLCDRITALVDENKHFTTPSKVLNEYPAGAKSRNEAIASSLDEMEACGKQMGVLALNAAIEAGRLGEAGKQFVTAAEDIRGYAARYDEIIEKTRTQLAEDRQHIEEIEEQVHRLVSLLKENNISTTKLMKSCEELVKSNDVLNESSGTDPLGEIGHQVTVLRNADEEIVKSEARNRMQVEDLTSEFTAQKTHQSEILDMMDPVFRHVVERAVGHE
jgi:hypothetical protein